MARLPTIALTIVCLFASSQAFGYIFISETMSKREQQRTGIAYLGANQRLALELWLNENFIPKPPEVVRTDLYLSENLNNGSQIRLNDGSLYEVAPSDRKIAARWITPFPLRITESGDQDYPWLFTNTYTGMKVLVRQIEPATLIK